MPLSHVITIVALGIVPLQIAGCRLVFTRGETQSLLRLVGTYIENERTCTCSEFKRSQPDSVVSDGEA
jgi:hypothetical protein